ncbi:MAG: energy transducer TonB [Bdellovibrionota bacterium]
MKQPAHKVITFTGVPKQGWYWVFAGIILSLLLHIISIIELPNHARNPLLPAPKSKTKFDDVKVNVVTKKKPDAQNDLQKKILEAPLEPTEAPTKDSRLGAQDHIAEKETKIDSRIPRPTAADPGQLGRDVKTQKEKKAVTAKPKSMTMTPKIAESDRKQPNIMFAPDGTVIVPGQDKMKPRNKYESLLPNAAELQNQVAAGYADHIDDEVATGDKIDMNTSNFRFIGYFTSFRKAFENVWVYPSEAVRRGLQGVTHVEFTIEKDGKVSKIRVVKTSGHKILDVAVVEAIRLASPFGPLPAGYNKERLTVTGSFTYVLTNYAGG